MSKKTNLQIDGGATYPFSVVYKNSSGIAIDLTGYSAKFQARRAPDSSSALIDLSSSNGLTITAEEGRIDVVIPASATTGLKGTLVYALDITAPGGAITRLLRGEISIEPDITT